MQKSTRPPPQVSLGCVVPHRVIHMHSPQARTYVRILTDRIFRVACSEVYNFQPRDPDLGVFTPSEI